MGLGLWESGLVLDRGWHGGAWRGGSQQWDQQEPGPLCPELCGTEEGAPGTRACAEVWLCHTLLLSVPWDPCSPRVPGPEAAL